MKPIYTLLIFLMAGIGCINAQYASNIPASEVLTEVNINDLYPSTDNSKPNFFIRNGIFTHLELGITAGSTGIGFDLASPIGEMVRLRAGFSFMPHFNMDMDFSVQQYNESGIVGGKFDQMVDLLDRLTGMRIDDVVMMEGNPTYYNGHLLVDVSPLKDKRWHVTAGFYVGNETIGQARNKLIDSSTMVGINLYNSMYQYFMDRQYMEEPLLPNSNIFLDPMTGDELREKFERNGRLGVHMGDYRDGTPYMMEPDENGIVSVDVKTSRWKPYLGIGFGDNFGKDKMFNLSVDAGLMLWGGTPRILTHDGVDLADLVNVRGKAGDYVHFIKAFKIFPALSVRLGINLF